MLRGAFSFRVRTPIDVTFVSNFRFLTQARQKLSVPWVTRSSPCRFGCPGPLTSGSLERSNFSNPVSNRHLRLLRTKMAAARFVCLPCMAVLERGPDATRRCVADGGYARDIESFSVAGHP